MGMRLMDVSRNGDGSEMTVELFDDDAIAEIRIETRPARVVAIDAKRREIEVDLGSMLHQGLEIDEGLNLDGPEDAE